MTCLVSCLWQILFLPSDSLFATLNLRNERMLNLWETLRQVDWHSLYACKAGRQAKRRNKKIKNRELRTEQLFSYILNNLLALTILPSGKRLWEQGSWPRAHRYYIVLPLEVIPRSVFDCVVTHASTCYFFRVRLEAKIEKFSHKHQRAQKQLT